MDGPETTTAVSSEAKQAARRLLDLIVRRDPRTQPWLAEEPVRVAASKLLFFTTPGQYREFAEPLREAVREEFSSAPEEIRYHLLSFALAWTDSLNSPVELHHNLSGKHLHGREALTQSEIRTEQKALWAWLSALAGHAPGVQRRLLQERRDYTFSVNSAKGLNLFKRWAERWQDEKGKDPFGSIESFLEHRAALFARGNYYVDLYFARAEGKSITQFFNDYSEQAQDCRKLGSLGGTTNPVIATFGEDDLPGKWGEARRLLADQARAEGLDAEWAGTAFTELVVFNAQIAQRPVFLLEGLGRISFQLRTDKAEDADYLLAETPEIYARLRDRLEVVDEIFLDGADTLYHEKAQPRLGESNNHFKVSVSGPTALRVLREFNAGNNRLGVRMYTNSTVTHDLSQITAALDATLEGMDQWEARTGLEAAENEGHFGSVVTSMMGRYVDGMRGKRIAALLAALGKGHPLYGRLDGKVSGKSPLNKPPLGDAELVEALAEKGVEFRPEEEEDAVRNLATLITKTAILYAVNKFGEKRGNRILSASKRFFAMNTDLENEHRYATDFGDIQAESLDVTYHSSKNLFEGFDRTTGLPVEDSDNVWWRRMQEIRRIFPDGERHLKPGGIPPEEWMDQPYNAATMKEFTAKWWLNVRRAEMSVELLDGKYRGADAQREFAEKFYGHLGDRAAGKAWRWAQSFFTPEEFAELDWKEPAR